MELSEALEEIGWGRYQKSLYYNCISVRKTQAIFLSTLWMEMTSLIMQDLEGEYYEKVFLPVCLNLGSLLGCYILSYYVSTLGRAYIFKLSIVITSFGGLILCMFPFRFFIYLSIIIIGFGVGGDMVISYTLLMESIPLSKLEHLTLLNIGWSAGICFFLLVSLLLRLFWKFSVPGWMLYAWVGTFLSGICSYFRSFLLESPMFLHSRGDIRLESVLKQIAEINENKDYKPIPKKIFKNCSEIDTHSSIFDEKNIKNTVFLSLEYFFSSFPYCVLLFFSLELQPENSDFSDIFLFFEQISGIPGIYCASYLISSNFGLKETRIYGFFISGILCTFLLVEQSKWGHFCINSFIFFTMMMSLSALYTHSQEIYTTSIRSMANGWLCGLSLIAGIIGPIIVGQIGTLCGFSFNLYLIAFSFFLSGIFAMFVDDVENLKIIKEI